MIIEQIENHIMYGSESPTLDFKKDQYPIAKGSKKHELLKDISAMANHPDKGDKFIIIGVKDKTYYPVETLHDEAQYQEYVNSNIEPHINFEYRSYLHEGNQLAYFRIFNNTQKPYLLKNNINTSEKSIYRAGDGFIRSGSSTRRLLRDDFEKMYRDRYSMPDRKSDIEVECYLMHAVHRVLERYNLYLIDVSIKNNSNQSISVGVELKFKKPSESFTLMRHEEAISYIEEEEETRKGFRNSNPPPYYIKPSSRTSIHGSDGYYSLALKRDIVIPQSKQVSNLYSGNLVMFGAKSGSSIEGEITVRSDSFSSGPLVHKFNLQIP